MKNSFQIKIISIIFLLFFNNLFSQVQIDLQPNIKSPEVNKFEQYLNMPVNMVSGTPSVSIPIYNIDYAGMSLPISLSYDASGLKVEESSSAVGLKWSLNIGGVISRIVKGAPDEGNPYAYPLSQINIDGYYQDYGLSTLETQLNSYSKGDPYQYNTTHPRASAFNLFLQDLFTGYKDSQPDLFYFSTPQGGAKFVFNDNREIVYLENTDFRVKETYDTVNNRFTSWEVTSPNGIKYTFGTNDLNEANYSAGVGEITNQFSINSWFLKELDNVANNQNITIDYIDNNYRNIILNKPSKDSYPCLDSAYNNNILGSCSVYGYGEYGTYADNNSSSPKYSETHTKSKLISKITAGETIVDFIYSHREDLLPELFITPKRLDKVIISNGAGCIKEIVFNYSYALSPHINTGMTTEREEIVEKRLVLDSVIEKSCDGSIQKPYTFIYDSQIIPNKLSYGQDKWGFYNGKDDNLSLFPKYLASDFNVTADRNVNFNKTKTGSLEKMIYPTGGSVEFEYESHHSVEPTNYIVDDWGAPLFTLNTESSTNNYASTNLIYNPDKFYKMTISMRDPMAYSQCGASSVVEITSSNNTSGIPDFTYYYTDLVERDCFSDGSNYNCITTLEVPVNDIYFQDGVNYTVEAFGYDEGVAGTCLAATVSLYEADKIPTYEIGGLRVKKVIHKDIDGSIAKEFQYSYLEPKVVSNPTPVTKIRYDYDTMYNRLNGIISYNNINYLRIVANTNNNNGSNSLSGYYFDYSTGHDPFDLDFMGPHITYGSVIETDGNGESKYVYETYKSYLELNSYQEVTLRPAPPKIQSILAGDILSDIKNDNSGATLSKSLKEFNYSRTNTDVVGINITKNSEIEVLPFDKYYIQGQTKTLKTDRSEQHYSANINEVEINYFYENNQHNLPTKIITSNSDGKTRTIKNFYPPDLPTGDFMADLINQNRIGKPIKSENYVSEDSSLGDLTSVQEEVYSNSNSPNGLILPYKIKFQKDSVGAKEDKIIYEVFDNKGNPLEVSKLGGTHIVYIWGYNNDQYPIAKIENATFTAGKSNTITSGQQTLINNAVSASINESTETTENNLRSKLQLLREGFLDAMVTTYTYDPLIGVTSITDPKGYTIYYEYDGFNRLKQIKDADGNIISENNYHYKNQ